MLKANPSYPAHCCCSVTKSYLTLCDLTDCSMPGFPVLHYLQEFAQTHVYWVSDAISSCYPLLLLPSIFPSIRAFSHESALRIRWTEYWSFSFSISPSNEYSGLISLRIDWFDLCQCCPRDSQETSPEPQFESINFSSLRILTSIYDYWKNHRFNYTGLCQQSDVSTF